MKIVNILLTILLGTTSLKAETPMMVPHVPASFADAVAPLLPAVVNIATTMEVRKPKGFGRMPLPFGFPGEDFDGLFSQKHKATSLGSGFLIDPQGYVVTNHHVVAEADEITVILNDQTKLPAKVVGIDHRTDLALLKVDSKKPLPYVTWGDDKASRVGDWVIVIGNPFGLGSTVTTGIISNLGRDISSGEVGDADLVEGYIQTDAAVNMGNSGGPLFDTSGRVIGVNRAIISPTGGSVGIGFAIPASVVKPVVEQLKANGRVKRGWIGANVRPVDEDIASELGLGETTGVMIASVKAKGPGEKAGLLRGDIILSVNEMRMNNPEKLIRYISNLPIGKPAKFVVWRKKKKEGKKVELSIVIEERPSEPTESPSKKQKMKEPEGKNSVLGLLIQPLTPEVKEEFDISDTVKGVAIVDIKPGSPAYEAKLLPGDVIVEVRGVEVETVEDFLAIYEKAKKEKSKSLLCLINRADDVNYVVLKLEDRKDK